MFSPNIQVSDENENPPVLRSHRKSFGRTPLQDLMPQSLNLPETNCITNKISLALSSCLNTSASKLPLKEVPSCKVGTPVNVWVDTDHLHSDIHSRNLKFSSTSGECQQDVSVVKLEKKHSDYTQLSSPVFFSSPHSTAIDVCDHTYCSSDLKCNTLQKTSTCAEVSINDLVPGEYITESSLEVEGHTGTLSKEEPGDLQDDEYCIDNCLQLSLTPFSPEEPYKQLNIYSGTGEASLYPVEKKTKADSETPHVVSENNDCPASESGILHSINISDFENTETNLNFIAEQNERLWSLKADINSMVIANEMLECFPCLDHTEEQSLEQCSLDSSDELFTALAVNNLHSLDKKNEDEHCSLNAFEHDDVSNVCQDLLDCVLSVENLHLETDVIQELNEESSFNIPASTDEQKTYLIEQVCFDKSKSLNIMEIKDTEEEVSVSESDWNLHSKSCILQTADLSTCYEADSCKMVPNSPDNFCSLREDLSDFPFEVQTMCSFSLGETHVSQISDTSSVCDNPSLVSVKTPFFPHCCISQLTPISGAQDSIKQQSLTRAIPISNMKTIPQMTPKILCSPLEAVTCVTPTSTCSAATWTTPIMLLNKSLNTSWDFVGKVERNARDNASETDSLLWNFSRVSFRAASKEELMSRLESTLIVIEVLSRQLQEWQQGQQIGSSSRPSDQREVSTQTCVTYSNAEEQYYHNLYTELKVRFEAKLRTNEEEEKLKQMLGNTTQILDSYITESTAMIKFTEKLYAATQIDKADLNKKISQARNLLVDHMVLLRKMDKKIQANMLQREEMRGRMESAFCAKEAADQCLKDLELHSSKVIAQLQRNVETEKQLSEAVGKALKEQLSYKENLADFANQAKLICSEMEDSQNNVKAQCSQARELMAQHWRLFEVMKKKTVFALQEFEAMKCERDVAFLEKETVCSQLEDMKSQNAQLTMETTRLSSELASLIDHLCKLESEIDHFKQENSELVEELSAKDSSLKLIEKELNEATTRGQEIRKHNKQLSEALDDVVTRLEMGLSETEQQKLALQMQIKEMERQHATQISIYTESIEFLEQENGVCREQVAETESQLKTNLFALRERNLLCETQKDTIRDLQKEYEELQEELQITKCEARDMLLKMGKEISDSSMEISQMKASLQELTKQMKNTLQEEQVMVSKNMPHTPARPLVLASNSLAGSVLKGEYQDSKTEFEVWKAGSIWSETSAFSKVQPLTSPTAGEVEENLPDILHELSDVISDFTASSSQILERKEQGIQDLRKEIFALKEELRNTRFQTNSDIRDMKEEIEKLQVKNRILDESLSSKQQCIRELEEIVHQQEEKLLSQLSFEKEREEMFQEHTKLKRLVQLYENEAKVLKEELGKNYTDAARDWIQEKLMLHHDLTKLRLMLLDTEDAKAEIVTRAMRHRDILERNLTRSEMELKKLDDVLEKIRETLLSIPEVVSNCEKLKKVMEYLN